MSEHRNGTRRTGIILPELAGKRGRFRGFRDEAGGFAFEVDRAGRYHLSPQETVHVARMMLEAMGITIEFDMKGLNG